MMPCDQRQKLGPFSFLETWVASVLCPFILSVFFFSLLPLEAPESVILSVCIFYYFLGQAEDQFAGPSGALADRRSLSTWLGDGVPQRLLPSGSRPRA